MRLADLLLVIVTLTGMAGGDDEKEERDGEERERVLGMLRVLSAPGGLCSSRSVSGPASYLVGSFEGL